MLSTHSLRAVRAVPRRAASFSARWQRVATAPAKFDAKKSAACALPTRDAALVFGKGEAYSFERAAWKALAAPAGTESGLPRQVYEAVALNDFQVLLIGKALMSQYLYIYDAEKRTCEPIRKSVDTKKGGLMSSIAKQYGGAARGDVSLPYNKAPRVAHYEGETKLYFFGEDKVDDSKLSVSVFDIRKRADGVRVLDNVSGDVPSDFKRDNVRVVKVDDIIFYFVASAVHEQLQVYEFDTQSERFTLLECAGDAPAALASFSAVPVASGADGVPLLAVCGGQELGIGALTGGSNSGAHVHLFEPASATWHRVSVANDSAESGAAAGALSARLARSGSALFVGGQGAGLAGATSREAHTLEILTEA